MKLGRCRRTNPASRTPRDLLQLVLNLRLFLERHGELREELGVLRATLVREVSRHVVIHSHPNEGAFLDAENLLGLVDQLAGFIRNSACYLPWVICHALTLLTVLTLLASIFFVRRLVLTHTQREMSEDKKKAEPTETVGIRTTPAEKRSYEDNCERAGSTTGIIGKMLIQSTNELFSRKKPVLPLKVIDAEEAVGLPEKIHSPSMTPEEFRAFMAEFSGMRDEMRSVRSLVEALRENKKAASKRGDGKRGDPTANFNPPSAKAQQRPKTSQKSRSA